MNGLFLRTSNKLLWALALLFVSSISARADDAPTIYAAKCASCHAADGTGNTTVGKLIKARDFHDPAVAKETDTELAAIIAQGKNKMPEYDKTLKPADIQGLVVYVRKLGK